MADIGKPMKRVRVVPLTEPVPDRTEPALPAPAPREPVPEKV
jgi:hypothetical protein